MPSLWHREVAAMPNLYDCLDYQNKTLLETICRGRFLKKNEYEGWEIYEDLA